MDQTKLLVTAPSDPDPEWPDGYVVVLREAGAKEKNIPYCVGWVRRFFARFPGRPRRSLGRTEVEAFLSEATAHPGISNWHVQQARDTLELYYERFRGIALEPRQPVSAPACENHPQPSVSPVPLKAGKRCVPDLDTGYAGGAKDVKRETGGRRGHAQADTGGQGQGESAPDAGCPTPHVPQAASAVGAGRCDWKVLVERLKDALRTEHYAYATEQN